MPPRSHRERIRRGLYSIRSYSMVYSNSYGTKFRSLAFDLALCVSCFSLAFHLCSESVSVLDAHVFCFSCMFEVCIFAVEALLHRRLVANHSRHHLPHQKSNWLLLLAQVSRSESRTERLHTLTLTTLTCIRFAETLDEVCRMEIVSSESLYIPENMCLASPQSQ